MYGFNIHKFVLYSLLAIQKTNKLIISIYRVAVPPKNNLEFWRGGGVK